MIRFKKIKIHMVVFYILLLAPLLVTVVLLLFLPDQVPAHYDRDGVITRLGSKYELLLFPLINIVFGIVFLAISKKLAKNGELILIWCGANLGMLTYNIVIYILLADAFAYLGGVRPSIVELVITMITIAVFACLLCYVYAKKKGQKTSLD